MARTQTISLLPASLNLKLYAGDGATLRLTVQTPDGSPLSMDGVLEAQIRQTRDGAMLTEFEASMVDADTGVVLLALAGEQTAELIVDGEPFSGQWDAQWTPTSGEPITLIQGAISVSEDVTR